LWGNSKQALNYEFRQFNNEVQYLDAFVYCLFPLEKMIFFLPQKSTIVGVPNTPCQSITPPYERGTV
jgi:hypothetical protein